MQVYRELEESVLKWSEDRGIIPNAKPHSQLLKLVSEVGELCDAEAKGDVHGMVDSVGDVMVCLINYCALRQLDMLACLSHAYESIKDRKGRLMPDGTFVKEEQQ